MACTPPAEPGPPDAGPQDTGAAAPLPADDARVLVHVDPGTAHVVVSAPDGRFVRTVQPGDRPDVSLRMPDGGVVSTVAEAAGTLQIHSIAGVRDGDELWLRDPLPVTDPLGMYTLDVGEPSLPYEDVRVTTGPCGGWNGAPLPLEASSALWADCFDDTGALNAIATVRRESGDFAVATHPNVDLEGAAPLRTAAIVLDDWQLAPAVLRVQAPLDARDGDEVVAEGFRAGVQYLADRDPALAEVPTPQDFFTLVRARFTSWRPAAGGEGFVQRWVVPEALPEGRGVREVAFDDRGVLPDVQVDRVSGRVALAPATQACAGEPYAVVDVQHRVLSRQRLLTWQWTGPWAESIALPELDPALGVVFSEVTPGELRESSVVVQTAAGVGWDGVRNARDLRRAPELSRALLVPGTAGCDSQRWLEAKEIAGP